MAILEQGDEVPRFKESIKIESVKDGQPQRPERLKLDEKKYPTKIFPAVEQNTVEGKNEFSNIVDNNTKTYYSELSETQSSHQQSGRQPESLAIPAHPQKIVEDFLFIDSASGKKYSNVQLLVTVLILFCVASRVDQSTLYGEHQMKSLKPQGYEDLFQRSSEQTHSLKTQDYEGLFQRSSKQTHSLKPKGYEDLFQRSSEQTHSLKPKGYEDLFQRSSEQTHNLKTQGYEDSFQRSREQTHSLKTQGYEDSFQRSSEQTHSLKPQGYEDSFQRSREQTHSLKPKYYENLFQRINDKTKILQRQGFEDVPFAVQETNSGKVRKCTGDHLTFRQTETVEALGWIELKRKGNGLDLTARIYNQVIV